MQISLRFVRVAIYFYIAALQQKRPATVIRSQPNRPAGLVSALSLWLSAALLILIVFNRFNWRENTALQWDQSGYYIYLPAAFIYQDIDRYAFYPELNRRCQLAPGSDYYALYLQAETGRRLNKYPIGVSLFHAPFFLAAHAVTKAFTHYPPDGFSPPYRLFICLGTVFWSLGGLWLLRAMLRRYFSDGITAVCLLLLLFATNLYNYTAFDPGMSHTYSFFLFAAALFLADRWSRLGRGSDLALLGLASGLIVIVRPLNVLLLPLLLIWQPGSDRVRNPFTLLRHRLPAFAAALLLFGCALLIQCAYWKYASGHWVHYSYEGEGFDFRHPRIIDGLLSYRKGWFVYTPLALFAILGLIPLGWKRPWIAGGIAAYLALVIYAAFSWHQWYYGGSFGCRVLIESLAVLSLPLACLIAWLSKSPRLVRLAGSLLLGLCLALNTWQTYQFNIAMIPTDGNTKEWYWRAFFKLEKTPEDEALFRKIVR